jgi:hypothetical protein
VRAEVLVEGSSKFVFAASTFSANSGRVALTHLAVKRGSYVQAAVQIKLERSIFAVHRGILIRAYKQLRYKNRCLPRAYRTDLVDISDYLVDTNVGRHQWMPRIGGWRTRFRRCDTHCMEAHAACLKAVHPVTVTDNFALH